MGRTIKAKIKRFASLLLAVVMLATLMPTVLANPAENFSDFPTGWSKPAMEAAVNNGLLVGVGEGKIGPEQYLTRAEMAAVMVRAFGATTYTDISGYTDVDPSKWYYASIASAVKMGALSGISDTEMAPESYITREQVFTVLARILALSGDNYDVVGKFNDGWDVSAWALTSTIALVERGYVSGNNHGYLNPKAPITREEFAQLMYSTIKTYITAPGVYENMTMEGIVVIRVGNVTLRNVQVLGDLVIGDGAATVDVILENTSISGRLLARGGTNTLKDCVITGGVVVLNPNGITMFRNYGTELVFAGMIQHTGVAFISGGAAGGVSFGGGSGGTKTYTVTFKKYSTDRKAYATIRVEKNKTIGNKMPADPIEPGYDFKGWFDSNGTAVTSSTKVTKNITAIAKFDPTQPGGDEDELFTVTFYEGHNKTDNKKLGSVTLKDGTSISQYDDKDLPTIGSKYEETIFQKSNYVPYDGSYKVMPEFWYKDNGVWKHFDESTVVKADTDVHLLYQQLTIGASFSPADVSAKYDSNLRLVDSAEVVSHGMAKMLKLADDTNNAAYKKLTGKVFDTLEKKDVIDGNKNIKMLSVPVEISEIVKKEVADGMVKSYIRDMVNDPDKLDELLSIIDIEKFIEGIDINVLIDSLSSQQIADLITDAENEDLVVNFLYNDLQKADSKMIGYAVDYVINDEDFRDGIVDDLMIALADADDESSLKMSAIAHLKVLLQTEGSTLQNKFATMLIDSLTGTNVNTELKGKIITQIKTNGSALQTKFAEMFLSALKSDETNAMKEFAVNQLIGNGEILAYVIDSVIEDLSEVKQNYTEEELAVVARIKTSAAFRDLIVASVKEEDEAILSLIEGYVRSTIQEDSAMREKILTDEDQLATILELMEDEVIDLVADPDFIETVLEDDEITKTILNSVIEEPKIISYLVTTNAFIDEIVPEFHEADGDKGLFVDDVRYLVGDSDHREDIFESVLANEDFIELVSTDDAVAQEILDAMTWDKYVDEEDLLKYIFGQDRGVGPQLDYKHIITEDEINEKIVDEFNALLQDFQNSADAQQIIKDVAYENAEIRTAIGDYIEDIIVAEGLVPEDIYTGMVSKEKIIDCVLGKGAEEDQEAFADVLTELGVDEDTIMSDALANVTVDLADIQANIQDIKDTLYADGTVTASLIDELKAEFEQLKNDVLDDIIDKKPIDENVKSAIYDLLDEYVEMYITQDADLDSSVKEVIESILVDEIRNIILSPEQYPDAYDRMEEHIGMLREKFIGEDYEENKDEIKEAIANFAEIQNDDLKAAIGGKYDELSGEFAGLIDVGTDLYVKVDKLLKDNAYSIDASIINSFVVEYSKTNEDDCKALIDEYLPQISDIKVAKELASYLSNEDNVAVIKPTVENYISDNGGISAEDITNYAKNNSDSAKNMLLTIINNDEVMTVTKVEEYFDEFLTTSGNSQDITNLAIGIVAEMEDGEVATYLADFLAGNADNQSEVRTEIEAFITDEAQIETVKSLATTYVKASENAAEIKSYIKDFVQTNVDAQFIEDNSDLIDGILDQIDKEFILEIIGDDGEFIKNYIAGLETENEKIEFSNKIYDTVSATQAYQSLMADMFDGNGKVIVNAENITMIKALEKAIRALTIDSALSYSDNATIKKVIDLIGEDVFKNMFEKSRNEYCDGLVAAIAEVEDGEDEVEYTTALTVKINPVKILDDMYDDAQAKLINKLIGMNIYYNDNTYLQLIAQQDVLARLLTGDLVETDELTGYTLRTVPEYANYMVEQLILADDALCWYGDTLDETKLKAVYEAMFAKLYTVHDKLAGFMNDFTNEGTLPAQLETALDTVKQLNDIFLKVEPQIKNIINKYLESDIFDQVAGGEIDENAKVQSAIDVLFGTEDPVFTIDSLYSIFYNYDDKMQAKLKELVDSGKLDEAIEEFKNSAVGKNLEDNVIESIVEIIENVAANGIDAYKVDTSSSNSIIDKYELKLGDNEFSIARSLIF